MGCSGADDLLLYIAPPMPSYVELPEKLSNAYGIKEK